MGVMGTLQKMVTVQKIQDMITTPPPQTPGLTDLLSVLCVENNECVCSYGCTGMHAHEVGPRVDNSSTVRKQDNADMRNVRQESEYFNKHSSTKNNLMTVIQTPGLSAKLSKLQMEEDECVCAYRCSVHEGEDNERDECVCTISCEGVHTHKTDNVYSVRDNEYELGLKYCPGLEPTLPVYTHVQYKPSTSKGRFTIYNPSMTAMVLGEGAGGEAVGGQGADQPGGGRGESVRKDEGFQQTEVNILISEWEKRAGGGEVDSLALPDNGGRERRRSQDFQELRQKFVDIEEGGGVQSDARPKSGTTELSKSITTQGRGAMRKLCFSNFNISSIVGRK